MNTSTIKSDISIQNTTTNINTNRINSINELNNKSTNLSNNSSNTNKSIALNNNKINKSLTKDKDKTTKSDNSNHTNNTNVNQSNIDPFEEVLNGMKSKTNTELSRDRSLDEILESTPDKINDNSNIHYNNENGYKISSLSPINIAQDQSNFISPKNNFLCDDNGSTSQTKTEKIAKDFNINNLDNNYFNQDTSGVHFNKINNEKTGSFNIK